MNTTTNLPAWEQKLDYVINGPYRLPLRLDLLTRLLGIAAVCGALGLLAGAFWFGLAGASVLLAGGHGQGAVAVFGCVVLLLVLVASKKN